MNNEIKEILEHIKLYPEKIYCLSEKEKIIILDYITNLQQENEDLKKKLERGVKMKSKYCVIPEEVRFDIEMELYEKYNYRISKMYDYLGELYTLKDIKDVEELEKYDRKWMISDYLMGKRKYTLRDLEEINMFMCGGKNNEKR